MLRTQSVTQDVMFPVYVLAKDCGDVMEFESLQRMQSYLEAIDVENDEYKAWDAKGRFLKLVIGESRSRWLHLELTGDIEGEEDFADLKEKAKRRRR